MRQLASILPMHALSGPGLLNRRADERRFLVSAVRSGDAAQAMARTDLPRARNSFIDQVVSGYLDMRPVRPLERRAINALGAAIADGLAMKLMTAENLSVLLRSGTVGDATDNITFGTTSPLAELDIPNIFAFAGRITPVANG